MKYKWLQKNNNPKLIVFFNGWGMDENAVKHLDCEDYDVVVLYDYNNLELDLDLKDYKEKHIIGWSMGVMVLTMKVNEPIIKNAKSITAVAGTTYPIDDKYGIPKRVYHLTIGGFNLKTAEKFIQRMDSFVGMNITQRGYESMETELVKMTEYKSELDCNFTKVIIPENDLIIPTKNQLNYWHTNGIKSDNIIMTKSGHYPFLLYNKWSELI